MAVMRSVILLLFLMKTALAAPSVYVVSESLYGEYDGVYEEKREPELHYKKLGEADKYYGGHFSFIYTDSRRPQTWIIGWGKTVSTVEAHFRAPAKDGRPAVTQWRYVHDWSREGKEQGDPKLFGSNFGAPNSPIATQPPLPRRNRREGLVPIPVFIHRF